METSTKNEIQFEDSHLDMDKIEQLYLSFTGSVDNNQVQNSRRVFFQTLWSVALSKSQTQFLKWALKKGYMPSMNNIHDLLLFFHPGRKTQKYCHNY